MNYMNFESNEHWTCFRIRNLWQNGRGKMKRKHLVYSKKLQLSIAMKLMSLANTCDQVCGPPKPPPWEDVCLFKSCHHCCNTFYIWLFCVHTYLFLTITKNVYYPVCDCLLNLLELTLNNFLDILQNRIQSSEYIFVDIAGIPQNRDSDSEHNS